MARAGSALWLLRHELKLFLFSVVGARGSSAKPGASRRIVAVWTALAVMMHALPFLMLDQLRAVADRSHESVMAVSGLIALVLPIMLSTGLRSSVEALFERGDLDLLLSSPLPSRSIFAVRLAAIVVGIGGLYLFFLAPFAHVAAAHGQFRWLGIYPALIALSLLAASVAMLTTLALVRWLGIRRTRVVAQILGALAGSLIFLWTQAGHLGGTRMMETALARIKPLLAEGAVLGPDSPIWLPGRAVLGAPSAMLLVLGIGALAFVLTVRFTHRFFVHGVQQAASTARAAAPPVGGPRFHFGRGLARSVIVKEWRLIWRDPQLISQVLLQLLYLAPLCFVAVRGDTTSLSALGAGMTFLCGSLAGSLGWVVMAAEDAPDLLRGAPCSQRTIRHAKLAAIVMLPLAIVALPLIWLGTGAPLAALLILLCVSGAALCASLVALWCGKPGSRTRFATRAKGNSIALVIEFASGAAWAAAAYMLLAASAGPHWSGPMLIGAGAALLSALLIVGAAYMMRRRVT